MIYLRFIWNLFAIYLKFICDLLANYAIIIQEFDYGSWKVEKISGYFQKIIPKWSVDYEGIFHALFDDFLIFVWELTGFLSNTVNA